MITVDHYVKYRVPYAPNFINLILERVDLQPNAICLDVGAGTGLWSQQLMQLESARVIAVEPDSNMWMAGKSMLNSSLVQWCATTAEQLSFLNESVGLCSFASSLHLFNFDIVMQEVKRVLTGNGAFLALWNPRINTSHPLLVEIENHLQNISESYRGLASNKASYSANLMQRLYDTGFFKDVDYIEKTHQVVLTPEQFIGQWKTTQHLEKRIGEQTWRELMSFIAKKLTCFSSVEVDYTTKAWIATKKQ